ncbi:MAG: surface-adhesin E family protein [Methylotenera sp.]
MKKFVAVLLCNVLMISIGYAASWTQLQDNKHAKLMLDKQSIAASGKFQKAWVNIEYKDMQTNLEYPEKQYNHAKLLWYFNCAEQKSATAQVYQLLNEDLVFSAAIDVKRARFLEPVPETEIDIAMQYVCKRKAYQEEAKAKAELAKQAHENAQAATKDIPQSKPEKPAEVVPIAEVAKATDQASEENGVAESNKADEASASKKVDEKVKQTTEPDQNEEQEAKKSETDKEEGDEKKQKSVSWKYVGSKGPEHWGDLSEDFLSCKTGKNQSPIDIDKTITVSPSKLKTFQRFPALSIVNNGHTLQADFKAGNIMVVDTVMYEMKHVEFHTPSENTIKGKSFPLEAHFLHTDAKGNTAILAVMFEEGAENKALAKLWQQMPKTKVQPKKLNSKVLASDLTPRDKTYYRYNGSLTAPPCTEGVIWIVMKSPMTASKSQINAFKKIIRHDNNRPLQPLNGRIVLE